MSDNPRDIAAYAQQLIEAIPYARMIGVQCLMIGDEAIFKLPWSEENRGNPIFPAMHGAVIGGFMETAASLHLQLLESSAITPKVIDFSIDYLRAGLQGDTFAQCEVVRKGRNIVNVAIRAWQQHASQPIATARAHFISVSP